MALTLYEKIAQFGLRIPEFSGDENEDVKEFLRDFDGLANFFNSSDEEKARLLPILLTGDARMWIYSNSHLAGRTFKELSDALVKQFHSETVFWLLKVKLMNRKQLPGESVSQFASDILNLCRRLELSVEDKICRFVNGLRPELGNYVFLQRPKTFSEAETLARLKEVTLDEKPVDRTDEILRAIANNNQQVTGYNSTFHNKKNYCKDSVFRNVKPLGKFENAQLGVPQISQDYGQNFRHRKAFDDIPICDYCGKNGHVSFVCWKRQYDIRSSETTNTINMHEHVIRSIAENQTKDCTINISGQNMTETENITTNRNDHVFSNKLKRDNTSTATEPKLTRFYAVRSEQGAKFGKRQADDKRSETKLKAENSEHEQKDNQNAAFCELVTNSASETQQTIVHDNEIQGSFMENLVSDTAQPNVTISVPLNIIPNDDDEDTAVVTELNNYSDEFSFKQFSNAEECETQKENNEDILEYDYESHETLISKIEENTEIIEPETVKAYPATENFTQNEQNNERATNIIVSEPVEHTIQTDEIMTAEMLTLNFEVKPEEQNVVFEESQIIFDDHDVSCHQIVLETADKHELGAEGNNYLNSRQIRAKVTFPSELKEFELLCSNSLKFIHFFIFLMLKFMIQVLPPPYSYKIPRKRKPPDKLISTHISVWVN